MTASTDPASLVQVDLRALARQGEVRRGRLPLSALERLVHDLPSLPGGVPEVDWAVQAEWRADPVLSGGRAGGEGVLWLHLAAQAQAPQTCQRCLEAYAQPVTVDRWFRFVTDEATALAEDDDSEEDLLVFAPRFNVLELIEDELILALPLVPMHDVCPAAVRMSAGEEAMEAATGQRPNPFAALAGLKSGGSSGSGNQAA